MRMAEREEREKKKTEEIFESIMTENFPQVDVRINCRSRKFSNTKQDQYKNKNNNGNNNKNHN